MTARKSLGVQGFGLRLTLALVLIIAVNVAAISVVTFQAFDKAIEPELRQRTKLLGTLLRDDVQRALELGIPIGSIAGFDDRAAEIIADFPEVQQVRILSRDGTVLFDIDNGEPETASKNDLGLQTWKNSLPVLSGSRISAEIELTGNPRLIEVRLLRVLIDIGVIALAIILFGVEVILALAARNIWQPREAVTRLLVEQRDGRFDTTISVPTDGPLAGLAERLNDRSVHISEGGPPPARLEVSLPVSARLPVFLLAMGTETTASFLPIMAGNAGRMAGIPTAFAAAAPLVLYLLVAAAMAPIAGRLVRRNGAHRAFSWAVLPVMAGLVLMAATSSLAGVVLGRMFVGAGYTLAAISCSVYMVRAGGHGLVTQSQASLNASLFGGVLAGSVIGGILAFEAGYAAAILFGAGTTLIAALAAHWGLSGPAGQPRQPSVAPVKYAKSGGDFTVLVLCLAVPASASVAMVIWYLMPLVMAAQGFDIAIIARVVMLYYLAAILIAPLASHLFGAVGIGDKTAAGLGAALASVALLGAGLADLAPVTVVSLLGVGHAFLRPSLYALVALSARGRPERMDRFRMAERLGAVAAFVAAMLLTGQDDPAPVFVMLGVFSLTGLVVFAVFMSIPKSGGVLNTQ
ncbi:MFS transporter [Frigidibacter sp. ROC022]|uniref:MFS transporter n=1 Tax=Frigidibacter sp. ROC022 TaxID=2971796 RepID=UPI00215AEFEA|nr:MFS transporter [Frigidibacter sp. ROC022]MCR8723481.1 MFS transporter [Frigidibacter sp. ROC022]